MNVTETNSLNHRQSYAFPIAVVLTVITKVLTLWYYAPMAMGDSNAFIDAATEILSGTQWLYDAGINKTEIPPTLWRPIGYPLIIAGVKILFGNNWSLALCTIQATLSFLTGLLLFRLCLKAHMSIVSATVVFVLYQWSTPLSTDVLIMQDSLTGTLGTVSFVALLFPIIQNEIPKTRTFFLVGGMAAIAFLIRDVYHFIMPIFALIAFFVMTRLRGYKSGLSAACALVLPVFVISFLIISWNHYRTGSALISSTGQTSYIYAALKAAQYDESIIAGDSVFLTTIREENKTFDYIDTRRINSALFENHAMNSIEQAKAASQLFWGTLFTNPVPIIRAAMARVRIIQQGTLFSGPVTRLDDLHWWSRGASVANFYSSGWRANAQEFRKTLSLSSLTPEVALHLGLRTIIRILGVVALAIFLIGAPWLWLKMRVQLGGLAHAVLISWGVYLLWTGMFLPVSLEVRYLAPVVGPALMSIAIILLNFKDLIPQRWASRFIRKTNEKQA